MALGAVVGLETLNINVIPGVDLNASRVVGLKDPEPTGAEFLTQLPAMQRPGIIAGGSYHFDQPYADPLSNYILVHTPMQIRGGRLVEVARPEALPTTAMVTSLYDAMAVGWEPIGVEDWTSAEDFDSRFYLWDLRTGQVTDFDIPADTTSARIITRDLYLLSRGTQSGDTPQYMAVRADGSVVWEETSSEVAALLHMSAYSPTPERTSAANVMVLTLNEDTDVTLFD
ncbi:MAG: hypothetical protein Q4Q03_02670, partial [Bowdeniella nasicola]|nr:hypothetical protein [Bowdeniella nasicola]